MTRDDFQRAFVATSYLLDRRGEELDAPLAHLSPAARALLDRLANPDRPARAKALASELARIVAALETRRVR